MTLPENAESRQTGWRRLLIAVGVTVAAMTPVFMTSAQSAAIESRLHLSAGLFGLALACFFGATAIASPVARRLAVRLPVPAALASVSALSAACLIGLARCDSGWQLMALLAVAGCGNSLTQPVAARIIGSDIAAGRLSLAAGLVGAALGAAPFMPGLLVSTVGVPYGSRAAYTVAAALVAATTLLAFATRRSTTTVIHDPGSPRAGAAPAKPVPGASHAAMAWTVAAAIGSIGSSVCANFFVQIGTVSGLSTTLAGTLLTVASVLAVAVRIGSGALADRSPARNPLAVAAMMVTGAAGLAVITFDTPLAFGVGALLAVAGGWGWTGLLLASTMRILPGQGARAGAIMQAGLFTGTAVAPPTFGFVSAQIGVPATVGVAAVASLAAAALVGYGFAKLRGERVRPSLTSV
ncbi:MFS transporter [Phytomonospora endophytica]|uniref:MFS family permease n=1 Tax=Phytomonospora endophytica TaxID=714109 RepID=A0A841FPS1_9ACTN|nr:MFS transporter [Phytomonospora endophytica]MBB6036843.1 MFS family permease [Phytomonospora endophytica]GIG68123.1 hypothetical protein Pen01_44180 [Phytomonospora endophytica]